MRESVMISAARTPICRACRGTFNDLSAPPLAELPLSVRGMIIDRQCSSGLFEIL